MQRRDAAPFSFGLRRGFCLLLLAAAILAPPVRAQQSPPFLRRHDERLLGQRGVASDRAKLLELLRPRPATLEERLHYQELVQDLGSPAFARRESATRELRQAGAPAKRFLEKAVRVANLEVRRRAAVLLADINRAAEQSVPLKLAALRYLANQPAADDLGMLFDVLAAADVDEIRRACQTAILAVAQPTDEPLLRENLQSGAAPARIAALSALHRLQLAQDLETFLTDHDARLRVVGARLFAQVDLKRALQVAAAALTHPEMSVRADAADVLRAATGQRFGFTPYDTQERRDRAEQHWLAWIEKHAAALPAVSLPAAVDRPRHRVLACEISPLAVHEFDLLTGKVVFQSEAVIAPMGAVCYPAGWRIFADLGVDAIVAVGPTGKKEYQIATPGEPACLEGLANGRFLLGVASQDERLHRVIEIDETGKMHWQAEVAGQVVDAHRLQNGNTLVTNYSRKKIIELAPSGDIVWEIDALQPPESARRLPNGNTLSATALGTVREFSPSGEVVWSASRLPMAYDAIELPSGNVLVAYRNGLREVGRDGVVVREIEAGTVRRLYVY